MKRLTCPHCGHAFPWKSSQELNPFEMSRHCPSCGGAFGYSVNWKVFLLMFIPVVLVAILLRPWLGSWASFPGVLLVLYFSIRLAKVEEEEDGKPAK